MVLFQDHLEGKILSFAFVKLQGAFKNLLKPEIVQDSNVRACVRACARKIWPVFHEPAAMT